MSTRAKEVAELKAAGYETTGDQVFHKNGIGIWKVKSTAWCAAYDKDVLNGVVNRWINKKGRVVGYFKKIKSIWHKSWKDIDALMSSKAPERDNEIRAFLVSPQYYRADPLANANYIIAIVKKYDK